MGLLDRMREALRGAEKSAASGESVGGAEDASRAALLFAEALAESVSEGVVRVDDAGRVAGVNRAACRLFGGEETPAPATFVGLTLLEATHLKSLAELCQRAQRAGMIQEAEVRRLGRAEGVLRARAVPLDEPLGGVLLTLADLTELDRLRTIRTEFVANVSHELRTPLASIRATAETLLDGAIADPDYSKRFLETIIRESDRLVALSEDLLQLSRAEAERREFLDFDIIELVREVTARLTGKAERRGVILNLPPALQNPLLVSADRSQMDQVFFNLIDNAVKYTPPGGSVTILIEEQIHPARVAVSITDTGIGILYQDLPRIFERFWRADRARKFQSGEGAGNMGGTGLGLSIVKHIVEAHKGTVTAESELGQGSRFTVTLPMNSASSEP